MYVLVSNQPLIHGSRRKSDGLDTAQPQGHKFIKTEHPSDSQQSAPKQQKMLQPPYDSQDGIHKPFKQTEEPILMLHEGPWKVSGYVPTEHTMGPLGVNPSQDHDPWSSYSTRITMEHMTAGLPQGSGMTTESLPSGLVNPTACDFSFQPGFSFYDTPPWTDGLGQPDPGPT
jgi:hypothetical protein